MSDKVREEGHANAHLPVVALVGTLLIVMAIVFFALNRSLPGSQVPGSNGPDAQATPIHHYGAEYGPITATLVSPDDVSLQIVRIEKSAKEWLFHIHAHDNARSGVAFLNTSTSHFFMLGLRGIAGTPYTFSQLDVVLAAPSQAELAAHPALPMNVSPRGDVDGWLMADLSRTTFPPIQLFYVYGTVTAPACANPTDQNTCHPSTGYRTMVWDL